jgi:RNA polymerase sigma-70 factor (ECF subfamily)
MPLMSADASKAATEAGIWQAYRAELFRFVYRRVRDEMLAEDIVHDVFIKAHAHGQDLKDPGKLRPWLYRITRNALVDHHRARRPTEPVPEDLVGETDGGDDRAEQELARCLLPLLDGLPERYRHALTLAEIEGRTQREIAEAAGLSLSGAKSRVQRARRMLRDVLLRCCRVEIDKRGGVVDYAAADGGAPCRGCRPPAPKARSRQGLSDNRE